MSVFISSFFLFPRWLFRWLRVRKRRRTERGGGSPPPDSDPFSDAEFAKIYASLSRQICRKPDTPLRAPETPSAFHRRVRRNAFLRDARQRPRLLAPSESTAESQPKLHPAFLTLSAMISQFFTRLQRVEAFRGSAARMDEDGNQGNKKHRRKNCAAVAIDFLCTARPTTGLQNCRY
jgi:hypothetical protein